MNKISVVIPVYQNELNIPHTYKKIKEELDRLHNTFEYELIFVDDGSSDNSYQELLRVYEDNREHVIIIKLSRNFGQVSAWLAGIRHAKGDCIVVISADLQDPPWLISQMVSEWEKKNRIVIAARKSRQDGYFSKLTSRIFYGLMKRFASPNMPIGGFDFFLIDKSIKELIVKLNESNLFFQGQLLWLGYEPKIIYYDRRKRESGKTKWSLLKKIKYFIDGFVGYSFFPIRFISYVGIMIFFAGCALSAILIFSRVFYGTRMVGWTSIMIALLILSGFQLMMLGVMGEYLWRNLVETRKRPHYIIERIIDKDNNDTG